MADRVVIHVGPPKTGTTYLQSVLWANRAALREAGVLVPGRAPFDHNLLATYTRSDTPGPHARRVWTRVVAEMNAWPGTAVLSNEWFALTSRRRAARALAALAGADSPSADAPDTDAPDTDARGADVPSAELHVVGTARDFLRVAPAAWQERLKLGHACPLEDFVASLGASEDRWSWSTLDPAMVLARWGATLPRDRVHVVTVPPPGAPPGTLWERFADACGIPAGVCDLSVSSPNESIGAESARLLQLLGHRLRRAVDADDAAWTEQYRWLRRFLGHRLLVPRGGSAIALRAPDATSLRARGQESVAALRGTGWDVVGDLAELTSATVSPSAVHPDEVSDAALLEVASDLVVALLREVRRTAAGMGASPR